MQLSFWSTSCRYNKGSYAHVGYSDSASIYITQHIRVHVDIKLEIQRCMKTVYVHTATIDGSTNAHMMEVIFKMSLEFTVASQNKINESTEEQTLGAEFVTSDKHYPTPGPLTTRRQWSMNKQIADLSNLGNGRRIH